MRLSFLIHGLMLAFFSVQFAQAQVQIDAAKITCDQFVHEKVAPTRLLAAWFSGFYNGKMGKSLLDMQNFEANLNKVQNFCYDEKNFKIPVMQAIDIVLGAQK